MKKLCIVFVFFLATQVCRSQNMPDIPELSTADYSKDVKTIQQITESYVDRVPEFPGGYVAFQRYISNNMKYLDVAQLIGINGKIKLSFIIDETGNVSKVVANNCIGAGCEAEAEKTISASPQWVPGIVHGRAVKVAYTMPLTFRIDEKKVKISDLKKSDHGFIFNIKGALYTTDEAEAILGPTFESGQVDIAVPFYNYNQIAKFNLPDKKDIYLIIFKTS